MKVKKVSRATVDNATKRTDIVGCLLEEANSKRVLKDVYATFGEELMGQVEDSCRRNQELDRESLAMQLHDELLVPQLGAFMNEEDLRYLSYVFEAAFRFKVESERR